MEGGVRISTTAPCTHTRRWFPSSPVYTRPSASSLAGIDLAASEELSRELGDFGSLAFSLVPRGSHFSAVCVEKGGVSQFMMAFFSFGP